MIVALISTYFLHIVTIFGKTSTTGTPPNNGQIVIDQRVSPFFVGSTVANNISEIDSISYWKEINTNIFSSLIPKSTSPSAFNDICFVSF